MTSAQSYRQNEPNEFLGLRNQFGVARIIVVDNVPCPVFELMPRIQTQKFQEGEEIVGVIVYWGARQSPFRPSVELKGRIGTDCCPTLDVVGLVENDSVPLNSFFFFWFGFPNE